jgi:hypothetical protein
MVEVKASNFECSREGWSKKPEEFSTSGKTN